LETNLKILLTTDKKSDFQSWNKGRYDDDFEVDWGNWTELKVAWGCSWLFTATNSDKRQLDEASWRFVCFITENLLVSLKISWKKHSLNISPFPKETSHSKKASILKIFVQMRLLAVRYSQGLQRAWCQLQSLEDPHSVSKLSWSFV